MKTEKQGRTFALLSFLWKFWPLCLPYTKSFNPQNENKVCVLERERERGGESNKTTFKTQLRTCNLYHQGSLPCKAQFPCVCN